MENKKKIKDYTKRAKDNYNKKHDVISIMLPLGTKERIRNATGGGSVNKFINDLVQKELFALEQNNGIKTSKNPDTDELHPEDVFINYKP